MIRNIFVSAICAMLCIITASHANDQSELCDQRCNGRCLVSNMIGLAFGVITYSISTAATSNANAQIVATLCAAFPVPLINYTYEIYSYCKSHHTRISQ